MLGLANSKKKVDTTKADTSQSIKQLKDDKMWRENYPIFLLLPKHGNRIWRRQVWERIFSFA